MDLDGSLLEAAFLAGLRTPLAAPPGFGQRLAQRIDEARAAWPLLEVDPHAFVAYLAARLPESETDLDHALDEIHIADLFLTHACARGTPAAITQFERTYLSSVPSIVRRINDSPAFAEEVQQRLRVSLLVAGEGKAPKIATYAGRSPLTNWFSRVAKHVAIDDLPPPPALDQAFFAPALADDPGIVHMRATYQREFSEALERALASLDDRQKTVLRLSLRGVTYEAIGRTYGVTQPTVSRWIARAREIIADETERILHERLGVGSATFESVATMVVENLDLSLTRLLGVEDHTRETA